MGFHLFNGTPINNMPGLFGQRTVKGDYITFCKQPSQRNILKIRLLIRVQIVSQHLHSKAPANGNKYPPDFSCSDNPYRLSMQIHSCQTADIKIKFSGSVVSLMNFSIETQQHTHSKFSYCIRRISWYPHKLHFLFSCLIIHVAKAGTAHGYQLHPHFLQSSDYPSVQVIINKGTDHLYPFGQLHRLFTQLTFIIYYFITVIIALIKPFFIIGFCIK